LGRVGFEPT